MAEAIDRTDARGAAARRVLVVDDDADMLDVFQMSLEQRGHVVATAHDSSAAMQVASVFRPHVVLLDIELWDMGGLALPARLRALPHGRHAHIVALTGWGQPRDQERSLVDGFVAHLVKPVDLHVVLVLIEAAPRGDDA